MPTTELRDFLVASPAVLYRVKAQANQAVSSAARKQDTSKYRSIVSGKQPKALR